MGACTQKLKKLNKEAQEKKHQEKLGKHSKTQSMQTQESVQDKDRKPRIKEKLEKNETCYNFDHNIIMQTCKISKCYSIIQCSKALEGGDQHGKQTNEGVQIVQHNLTGRIRTMETLNKYDKRVTKYIDFLMSNQLTHPNLSQVHEIFQEEDSILVIQDYCSGGKLSQLAVKQGQGLEEHVALKILVQMVEGLNYIHSKNYTHGHLTFNSFFKIDESQSLFIKLVDIKSIYLKTNLTLEQLSYAAPEIIDNEQEYTISRDVWSIGVIFYKLLTGNLPYSGNTAQKLRSEIKKGVMQFQELSFDKISTRAKELLSKLFQRNPAMRSDLGSFIKTPLYRKIVSQTKQISKQTVGTLTNVKSANPIQTIFLQFLVNQFCQNQQQEINQMFNKYDQNGDAKLNKNEIYELLFEQLKNKDLAKQHVDHIFNAVDTDHNGTIDCHEFIRCIIDRQALITTPNLKIIFKMISNGRGFITKKRFMQCFQMNQQQTDEMYATATKTKRITFKVFSRIMMELI